MNENKEKIDFLLERNTAEQLAGVNWDDLNAAISARLNQAGSRRPRFVRFPVVFKIAAGIAAAAAVVLIAVMVGINRLPGLQINKDKSVVVKLIENQAFTSVKISRPEDKLQTTINIEGGKESAARCYVEIIDSDTNMRDEGSKTALMVIVRPKQPSAEKNADKNTMSMIYLF